MPISLLSATFPPDASRTPTPAAMYSVGGGGESEEAADAADAACQQEPLAPPTPPLAHACEDSWTWDGIQCLSVSLMGFQLF